MPTVAQLRGAHRPTYVIRYSGTGGLASAWYLPAAPTAAGSGAGTVPTSYSVAPDALPHDGAILAHNFYGDQVRTMGRLHDLVWVGPSVSSTSAATTTLGSVTLPARDNNGSSNGAGYVLGVIGNVTSSGTPTFSFSYTNQAGTSGRTTSTISASGGLPSTVLMYAFLQAGDTGVRSVESITVASPGAAGSVIPVIFRLIHTTHNRDGLVGASGVSPSPPYRRSSLGLVQTFKSGTQLMPAWLFTGSTSPTFVHHFVTVAYY